LEFKDPETNANLDFKKVKEQYLKLAHMYHPDINKTSE
jgi:DnaJ-class molecular chaperone